MNGFFWGSDDWASSKYVLEDIFEILVNFKNLNNLPSIISFEGDYINSKDHKKTRKTLINLPKKIINGPELRRNLFLGKIPPHQTTLFGPEVRLFKSQYNTEYRLAADMDYFLAIGKVKDLKYLSYPLTIINILEGGLSNKMHWLRFKEVWKIYFINFGLFAIVPFLFRYLRKIYLRIE